MAIAAKQQGRPRLVIPAANAAEAAIVDGLEVYGVENLRQACEFIIKNHIRSIAVPPLGCGNGGLRWQQVRQLIEHSLGDIPNTEIVVYEPTSRYQNVAKKQGVKKLTASRAMISELIRRYAVLGIPCTILEIQKMAWFLERFILKNNLPNELDLRFEANRYGPYADRLKHLLNQLDGSYLECDKRLGDASPMDNIRFKESEVDQAALFLKTEAKQYQEAFQSLLSFIDGFQSPLGMEALATVDWLISRENCEPNLVSIKNGISQWPKGEQSARRKLNIFSDDLLTNSIKRVQSQLLTA